MRGFIAGVVVALSTVALVGCATSKTIDIPANADATCSVVTHSGGGNSGGRR